jgi:hydrophobic/amphiphilic exporter-1 (mainly G- bacteria), HAE1 family
MSHLTRLSLRLGTVVLLVVVLVFGAGIWAATQVKQDLLPDISVPTYLVTTNDQGASPDVVDQQVTVPLTNAFQGISGVDTITSTSSSGSSTVIVSFHDGTNTDSARQQLSAALDQARSLLPQNAQNSTIRAFSTNELPILQYAVTADEPLADLSSQLTTIAVPKLKGTAGVSNLTVTGAPTKEVHVTVDPAKLAAHGIGISQVAVALQQAAAVQSVGTVKEDGRTIPVQIAGSLTSLDQIGAVTVTPGASSSGGAGQGGAGQAGAAAGAGPQPGAITPGAAATPVPISQLGTVQMASVPADTITRTNGKLSIGVQVVKAPGSNTVTVANAIKGSLPDLEKRIGHGARFVAIQDQATPITDAIASILREGLLGALFAVLVIFVFLRGVRATLVAAISIPLSLLIALIILWWQGVTLNILTLGGMMVAIGRVVDDAIVVLENISRHVAEGESPMSAAYNGAREILTAVTSSTLTTVAVFLPIVFLTGIAGSFFRPFALTVVVALLASLAVAVTVVPLLGARLLPRPRPRTGTPKPPGARLQQVYVPVIRWATGHRLVTLLLAGLVFAGSIALVPRLRVNLLDQSSSPDFPITLTMPQNATLAETDAETQTVEKRIATVSGVDAYQATVGGSSDSFRGSGAPADPTTAEVLVLVGKGKYNQVVHGVENALRTYGGPAKIQVGQAQSSSNSSSSQMQLDIRASNVVSLQQANDRVMKALSGVSGLANLKSNLAATKPQYQLAPTDKLAQSGFTIEQLGAMVAQEVNGQVAAQASLGGSQVNVRVQVPAGTADSPTGLLNLQVPTAAGPVPLSTLATLTKVPGPDSINRTDSERTATITGTITGNDTRKVQADVDKALSSARLPAGASTSTGGAFQQLGDLLNQFAAALLAAIGLVYLIMVATFRSLLKPLILLVSIPFAATGAIAALVVSNTALSLPGLIGLLMLTGIVVTNAIVLLDLVEQYRSQGLSLHDALIEGARRRLRPILMTALATMLALIPLAFSGDSGGAFIGAPLAVVVIGGLFTSTLLTLILVPVLYSFTSSRARDAELDIEAAVLSPAGISAAASAHYDERLTASLLARIVPQLRARGLTSDQIRMALLRVEPFSRYPSLVMEIL